jgi:hypothetical protein
MGSTSLEDEFSFDPKATPRPRSGERDELVAVETALLQEKADWDRIKASRQPDDFYAYLQKYPNGLISEQAQFRLDQIQQVKVRAQPNADGILPLPAGANRFRAGDELVYRSTDALNNTTRQITNRVTAVIGDRVEINGGGLVYDQMGSVLRNRWGTKDPGILMVPADLATGKRWRSAFRNIADSGPPSTNYYDFRVVGLETVTVPAGTFRAYRIERRGEARSSGESATFLRGTMWVDPATMISVRNELVFTVNSRAVEKELVELVRHTPVREPGR